MTVIPGNSMLRLRSIDENNQVDNGKINAQKAAWTRAHYRIPGNHNLSVSHASRN